MNRNTQLAVGMTWGVSALLAVGAQSVAAEAGTGYSLWSQVTHSSVADNNIVPLYGRTHYSGQIDSVALGFDRKINNRLLLGVSLSQARVSLQTPWNFGSYDSSATAIAPYATYLLNDTFTLSGSAGYAMSDIDLMSSAGALVPNTASYASDRAYVSVNLKASRWIDRWNLSGHLGYLYSNEDADGYTWNFGRQVAKTSTDFSQLDVGVKAAYLVGKLMPYVAISYGNDTDVVQSVSVPNRDQEGMVYTVGVNLFGNGPVSGGFYYRTVDRDNIEDDSLSANLTVRF
jgi:hypothetical protein